MTPCAAGAEASRRARCPALARAEDLGSRLAPVFGGVMFVFALAFFSSADDVSGSTGFGAGVGDGDSTATGSGFLAFGAGAGAGSGAGAGVGSTFGLGFTVGASGSFNFLSRPFRSSSPSSEYCVHGLEASLLQSAKAGSV